MPAKYLLFLISLVFVSCSEKPESPSPADDNINNFVLVADEAINNTFDPIKILSNGTIWINDTTTVDSLSLDLDNDASVDLHIIYRGEFSHNLSGELIGPVNETISMIMLDYIQLKQAHKYSDEIYTIHPFQAGDTLTANLNWQWLESPVIFQRKKNGGIGTWNTDKYYISYYKPDKSILGWLSYRIIFDDYLVNELQIEEYAEYKIPTI